MRSARGILAAGILSVAITGGYAAYRTWPLTHGTEVIVPATLARVGTDRLVDVRLDAGRMPGDPGALRRRTMRVEVSPGVTLAGSARPTREPGYVRVDFGFAPIPLPAGPPAPPPDAAASAVLRVLPSGRSLLVGIILNGTRY